MKHVPKSLQKRMRLILEKGYRDNAFDQNKVRKRRLLSHSYIKTISLSRQARDKHRESTQKESVVFL